VPTRQDFLRDVIRELAASGTTVLFATHLVHELERIVERLLVLHGGRLILDEDFDKVKAEHQASLEDIFCRLVAGA
jgi:ABC-2 type transport system ATP-binding protein